MAMSRLYMGSAAAPVAPKLMQLLATPVFDYSGLSEVDLWTCTEFQEEQVWCSLKMFWDLDISLAHFSKIVQQLSQKMLKNDLRGIRMGPYGHIDSSGSVWFLGIFSKGSRALNL